ncbi:MAG: RHS repeat-associated core domain-containing protein [Planctomycetaceae bacterium]
MSGGRRGPVADFRYVNSPGNHARDIGARSLHFRHYNPATDRFKSEDPAEDDLNLYRHVQNNPANEA